MTTGAMEDPDWGYLLQDVYKTVDRQGPLRAYEEPMEQMKRLHELKQSSPDYAKALMEQGSTLHDLAKQGALEEIHELLMELRQDEIILFFVDKMFAASCISGNLQVAEYMLRRGFNPSEYPSAKGILFTVLNAAILAQSEREEADAGGAGRDARARGRGPAIEKAAAGPDSAATASYPMPQDFLGESSQAAQSSLAGFARLVAGEGLHDTVDDEDEAAGAASGAGPSKPQAPCTMPVDTATTIYWLASHPMLRSDVNAMRPGDGYTPLHLAAVGGLAREAAVLISLGADVNAIGNDERTPLGACMDARRDYGPEDTAAQARFAIVEGLLKSQGGAARWGEAMSVMRRQATEGGPRTMANVTHAPTASAGGEVSESRRVATNVVTSGSGEYLVEEFLDGLGPDPHTGTTTEGQDQDLGLGGVATGKKEASPGFASASGSAAPAGGLAGPRDFFVMQPSHSGGAAAPRRVRDVSQFVETSGVAAPATTSSRTGAAAGRPSS